LAHDTREVRAHYTRLAQDYDDRANAACKRAYADLVRRVFAGHTRVLEIGAGSAPLIAALDQPAAHVTCDLTPAMLRGQRKDVTWARAAADSQALPFADSAFDGVFSINVLEHVPDPARAVRESSRVLRPGGTLLALTPNGDVAWLLDALERLRLKLPEGPHRFLDGRTLTGLLPSELSLVEQRAFLAFPAGPDWFVRAVDRLARGRGLFRYAIARKTGSANDG